MGLTAHSHLDPPCSPRLEDPDIEEEEEEEDEEANDGARAYATRRVAVPIRAENAAAAAAARDDFDDDDDDDQLVDVGVGARLVAAHSLEDPPPPEMSQLSVEDDPIIRRNSEGLESSASSSSSSEEDESLNDAVQLALDAFLGTSQRQATGLIYHEDMVKHFDPHSSHPERPERILAMMQVLQRAGLVEQMKSLSFGPALVSDLLLVHTQTHLDDIESLRNDEVRVGRRFELEMRSAFASPGTVDAAYLAAGGVIRACEAVLRGEVGNALCLVRPPGHHAEHDSLGGFCFFNSVAVGAVVALSRMGARRVVIVDWDVHHGNGIQHAFYESDAVLYISVHRWHNGNFYPGGPDGGPKMVGANQGLGYNINIGWNETYGTYGDAELLAAWDEIVVPACRSFDPDLVLVSAGFDAARGDPLGGCDVTPAGYGHLLHSLMGLAEGRVIVALEGGYSLPALAASGLVCAQVLTGQPPPRLPKTMQRPSEEAISSIRATIAAHSELHIEFSRRWTGRAFNIRDPASTGDDYMRDEDDEELGMVGHNLVSPQRSAIFAQDSADFYEDAVAEEENDDDDVEEDEDDLEGLEQGGPGFKDLA